jgi:hypothetical protein
MPDFSSLPTKTQENLARISTAVSGVLPIETQKWKIQTQALSEGGNEPVIINDVKKWAGKGSVFLYTFTLVSIEPDLSQLTTAFASVKAAEKGNRAYSRLNQPSKRMYVGSSEKIHQRIKEHLGFGARGTYSLQLAYWAQPFNLEIEIECAKYPEATPSEVLQSLEDTLWADLLPMFGRQGAR